MRPGVRLCRQLKPRLCGETEKALSEAEQLCLVGSEGRAGMSSSAASSGSTAPISRRALAACARKSSEMA